MSDLVERLRLWSPDIFAITANEAADEIERLRAALRVIANNTETDMVGDTWITQAAMVARRALEGKE